MMVAEVTIMTSECEVCGKSFERSKRHPKQATCGGRCANKRMDRVRRERTLAKRSAEGLVCEECGHPFVRKPHAGRQKFCSKRCADREMGRRYRARHGGKVGRHTRWGGNWMRALMRDENRCVRCGATEKLNVHHLDWSGESDAPNHDLDNLETLCDPCHRKAHRISGTFVDGEFFVSGEIFDRMGVTSVRVKR